MPGEWAASSSVQGAVRACRRQGRGICTEEASPGTRRVQHGAAAVRPGMEWADDMYSMYRAYEVAIQYIQARERTERKRGNGKRAGEGVGARMSDAGARRSVGRQRAWLRVTG